MSKKTSKKSDNTTMELRVSEVFKLRLKNTPRAKIVQYASKKWKISDRQVDTLIKKASDRIREILVKDADEAISEMLYKQYELYEKCIARGEYETARKTLLDIIKLRGLENPTKQEIHIDDKRVKDTDTATLLKIVKS